MNDKPLFIDTNILVYAHDLDAGQKHLIARDKVKQLWNRSQPPSISVQVLQEFYVTLIRKKIPSNIARDSTKDYLQWNVVENNPSLLLEGIRIRERWSISFWDALILAAAKRSGAKILWTEDLNAGQRYEGILADNPLIDTLPTLS